MQENDLRLQLIKYNLFYAAGWEKQKINGEWISSWLRGNIVMWSVIGRYSEYNDIDTYEDRGKKRVTILWPRL